MPVQIEAELLSVLPTWEEANGRPFMVQGYRVVDRIQDAIDAKEAAKEAKKVSAVSICGKESREC
jgi:protein regulator of cytokinesis 1